MKLKDYIIAVIIILIIILIPMVGIPLLTNHVDNQQHDACLNECNKYDLSYYKSVGGYGAYCYCMGKDGLPYQIQ